MLEIPVWITILSVGTVLLSIVLLIPMVLKSKEVRTQNKAHIAVLMWVLWALFQSVLSLNRWYMDRTAGWFHFVFPWFLALAFAGVLYFTPRGKRWINSLNNNYHWLIQSARIPLGIALGALFIEKQFPQWTHIVPFHIEIILGTLGILFFALKNKMSPAAHLVFHALFIGLTLVTLIHGYGAIPFSHQAWSYTNPNFAYQHFPSSLFPSVVYPILLFSHGQAIFSIVKNTSQNQ
jgi:hypothetical protein